MTQKISGLFVAIIMIAAAVAAVRPARAITYSTDPGTSSNTNSSAATNSSTGTSGSATNSSSDNSSNTSGAASGTTTTPSGGVAAGMGGADTSTAMAWTFVLVAVGAAGLIATRKNRFS